MSARRATRRVVVVGAGMGGLAASLALAARGLPVTLLERHAAVGGKARRVEVGGRDFDAGPTVFTMRWVFDALFARAGLALEDHLDLAPAELLARHSWVGSEPLDLYADIERSCAEIARVIGPRDADAYRRFAAKSERIFTTLDRSFMRAPRPGPLALARRVGPGGLVDLLRTEPFATLWRSLGRTFDDPRLRQLFARYATYCGSSPFAAPATLMLISHAERAGVWLVAGGMQALAETLLERARALGADCRTGAGVARLETRGGRVAGVVLEDGERLEADAIVFAGDGEALARGLLGDAVRDATPARAEPSLSAVTRCQLARASGFPLAHHTVLFGDDYADEFDAIFRRGEIGADPTVYLCAQDRDGSADARRRDGGDAGAVERLFCLLNAPARAHSTAEVEAADTRIGETLHRHGIRLDDDRGRALSAPDDFARLFPGSDGALYGRPTHGWTGSFTRPGSRSRLGGLYLAGASVHPGAGVPMATLSGQLAADALIEDLGPGRTSRAAARST